MKKWLNANIRMDDSHPFWFWSCLTCLFVAVAIAVWPFGPEGGIDENGIKYSYLALRPRMTDVLVAAIFMSCLYVRRCLTPPDSPIVWLLVIGDLLLFGSFFQMVLSSSSVTLFTLPDWMHMLGAEDVAVTPRKLAILILLLAFLGARVFAGVGIVLLTALTAINMFAVEKAHGSFGVIYIISAFVSVMLQFKIPGMHVNKSLLTLFAEDFQVLTSKMSKGAKGDMLAAGNVARTGVKGIASATTSVISPGLARAALPTSK